MFFDDPYAFESVRGNCINISKMLPEDVDIEEIAYVLSGEWRFGGHCKPRVSVAQHSLNVVDLLAYWNRSIDIQLLGLLHDAAEAYLRDIPRPVKRRKDFKSYRELENRILSIVLGVFGLSLSSYTGFLTMKKADVVMSWIEGSLVMPSRAKTWGDYELVGKAFIDEYQGMFQNKILNPLGMRVTERLFLERFGELRDAKKDKIKE